MQTENTSHSHSRTLGMFAYFRTDETKYSRPQQAIKLLGDHESALRQALATELDDARVDEALGNLLRVFNSGLYRFEDSDQGRYRLLFERQVAKICGVSSAVSLPVFKVYWRESILSNAWERLHCLRRHVGKPYFSILKTCVENPTAMTDGLVTSGADRSLVYCPTTFRELVENSREQFLEGLDEQIADSLHTVRKKIIRLELNELGLGYQH